MKGDNQPLVKFEKITGWRSRLHENYQSSQRNLVMLTQTREGGGEHTFHVRVKDFDIF